MILPVELIQVDHRQPKIASERGIAVMKVIRAVRGAYANAPSTGRKAAFMHQPNGTPIVPLPPGHNHQIDTPFVQRQAVAANAAVLNKYTMTDQGRTFLDGINLPPEDLEKIAHRNADRLLNLRQ